jgi:trans-aconitate methyltransferase
MGAAFNYNSHLIRLVLDNAPPNTSHYVDFGAGSGTFALELSNRGLAVECIEADSKLISKLRSNGFIAHEQISSMANNSQNYIYSLNVLEHINEDKFIIGQLGKKLSSNGKILVYVPAFMALWSQMDTLVGHVRRYSRKQMASLFDEQTWEIEKIAFVDSLGYFASIFLKKFGNASGELSQGLVIFYDKMIFPLSKLLDKLKIPFGKNIYVVARKL